MITNKTIKQKIAFVETNRPNDRGIYTKCNDFEPYGLGLLAGVARSEGHNVKLFQQNGRPDKVFAQEVSAYGPDTISLSSMAYNFGYSVDFAKEAKDENPNIKTIIGGPHISSYPQGLEQALNEGSINFGIQGEAEYSFRSLINSIDNPNLNIPGLIYLQRGKLNINPKGARIKSLDDLPFAVRDPKGIQTRLGKIMLPAQSKQIATSVISYSRGCPFSCSYCDSRSVWGNNVIWRSAENVADEMQELKEKYGTNALFFSDLTFNANPKKVHELCDELIDRDLGINWYVLARIATPDGNIPLIKDGLLEHMYEAGCIKIGLGLESVIPEIQKEFNKKIPNEFVRKIVDECHDLGMFAKGFLIIGDQKYESKGTVEKTLNELKEIKFDEIRISILTPFPGSTLYETTKADGSLMTKDLSKFTTDEQVIKCDNLSSSELKEARRWITSEYYKSNEYKGMVNKKISKFPELALAYKEHQEFLRDANLI